MAISDTQKVDLLYKKIAWAATKTDTNPPKEAYNEANPSPLLIRGDSLWQLSGSIPASIPSATSSIVQVYKDGGGAGYTATVECTELAVTDNRTWSTGLTNWIDPQFGATYFAKVYVDSVASTTPQTTGTALQAAGVNDDQWYFDYQSGILNFIGTNLPASIATGVTGKSVFISGARYVGPTGATNFSNGLTIGNITIDGNTITGNNNVTFGGNITAGNITINTGLFYSNGVSALVSSYGNTQMLANLAAIPTANIAVQGNITANYFIGNAAYLAGLPLTYTDTNVSSFLSSFGSNIITTTGNITGNIITNYITGITSNVITVTGTGSLKLPVGSTANRPVGQIGYIRYNTDSATFEYFDGTAWISIVNGITDQQIEPDGVSASYALSQSSTDIGVLVSINGVVQKPTVAYTVSGTTITFSQVPEVTDLIDVRFLATSVIHEFDNINPGTYLNRVTATQSPTLIDSIPITGNTALQWIVTAVDNVNTNYTALTISSINTGSQVYYTGYGVLQSNTQANVATFTSNISSGNINLWATGDSANVTVTFERLALGSATRVGYLTAGPAGTISDVLVSGVKTFALDTNGNVTLPIGGMINYANGVSILTGITSGGSTYSNANVKSYLTQFDGNLIPSANVTYSLGTSTNQWRDLWVSNNTIYVGNTPISVSNGTLLINNTPVTGDTTYSNANVVANLQNYVTSISTTANITSTANLIAPNFLFANGVNILSTVAASSTYSNTNVSAYLTSQNITSANIGSYQTWANANVSGLYNSITGANTTIQTLNANVGAYEIYANANIGTLYNGNISTQANLGAFQTYANTTVSVLQANLGVTQTWANANVATINANLGSYQIWSNANAATQATSINSLATGANANTAAYLAAGISTNVTTTGNISAGNVLINGALTSFGTVNPAFIVVGLTSSVTSFGNGSTFILDTVVGNVNSQTSYNTSTGVFTLTAGVTYDMSFTPSFISFSNTTGGFLCYDWVDATSNALLDTTGIGTGTAIPTTESGGQIDNPTARVIYTPSTNQTVKLRVTNASGTATLRGGIGTQAVVQPLNRPFALQSNITFANVTATNTANVGNLITTNGIYWANGTAWSSTTGTTYSNANVAAYLTAGNITVGTAGFTVLPNIVAQFTSNVNSYGQINAQNINSGSASTTEIVATANNGTDTIFFVDLGIAGNAYNNASPNNSLGNVIYANDAYLYAQGNTSANIGGNLAIGAATSGRTVKIFAGGINNTSTVATFSNTGIVATGNVQAAYFTGNGSALTGITTAVAGNIYGTSSNVTLVANTYSYTFANTGTASFPGLLNITSTANTNADSQLVLQGNVYRGGAGYHDFLRATNTNSGATNTNKYFRLDSTGQLQIISSAYTTNLFNLDDSGNLTVPGTITATSGIMAVPAWTSAGAITIGATTTAPTKPTTRVKDNISYRQVGAKQWEVVMSWVVTNATGAANGTGDYLFTLPNSLQFDTTLPSQSVYTSNVQTSTWAHIANIIPSGSGVITNLSVGGQVYPMVYSSTQFRILGVTTSSGVVAWGSGFFAIADTTSMQLTFRFTSA